MQKFWKPKCLVDCGVSQLHMVWLGIYYYVEALVSRQSKRQSLAKSKTLIFSRHLF